MPLPRSRPHPTYTVVQVNETHHPQLVHTTSPPSSPSPPLSHPFAVLLPPCLPSKSTTSPNGFRIDNPTPPLLPPFPLLPQLRLPILAIPQYRAEDTTSITTILSVDPTLIPSKLHHPTPSTLQSPNIHLLCNPSLVQDHWRYGRVNEGRRQYLMIRIHSGLVVMLAGWYKTTPPNPTDRDRKKCLRLIEVSETNENTVVLYQPH